MGLSWLCLAACVGFYGGALGGSAGPQWAWLCAGGALSALALLARDRSWLMWAMCLHGAAFAWSVALGAASQSPSAHPAPFVGGTARIELSIRRSGCDRHGCFAVGRLMQCDAVDGEACPAGRPLLRVRTQDELPLYARARLLARLRPRVRFDNPGPALTWPDTGPTVFASTVHGAGAKLSFVSPLARQLLALRRGLRRALNGSLAAPHAAVARAMLLGEASAVPRAAGDAIRSAGVSHLLAVSGLHIALLVGAWVGTLRTLILRTPLALRWHAERLACGAGAACAPLMGLVCGGSPSAMRAAWTSLLMLGLRAAGLRPSATRATALVVLAQLVFAPDVALRPGFILSVAATTALLTAPRSAKLWTTLRDSARAWLATAPFVLLWFGGASLVGVLANVVLVPVGSLLIPAALLHAACAVTGLGPWLGSDRAFEMLSSAFLSLVHGAGSLDPGLTFPPLSALQWGAGVVCALAWLAKLSLRLRVGLTAACLSVVLLGEWHLRHPLAEGELRATFLDVGQGDSTLLETADGRRVLIDAGGRVGGHGPDPGVRSVLPLLRALRIDRLDLVVLSHPHPDHYGGLDAVLEALPVAELWDSGQAEAEDPDGFVTQLLQRARLRGTRVRTPASLCGAPSSLGSLRFELLAPCPGFDPGFSPNDNSLVVRVGHGDRRFLFLGDAEKHQEAELNRRWGAELRADVLKVAHHGSRTSSTRALLASVRPWLSVVSAGAGNRFRHPHPQALARLEKGSGHVLRIDQLGGVRVVSDGRELRVSAPRLGVPFSYSWSRHP